MTCHVCYRNGTSVTEVQHTCSGDTSRNIGGGGGEIFSMYAFGVRLRYANFSNIMLGNASFQNTNSNFQNTNSSFQVTHA